MAARHQFLSGLDIGDHAAANAGANRNPVLRALHAVISRSGFAS